MRPYQRKCLYLCNRLNLNLDVAGSQIVPVEGKGQFPVITKLFRLIGKDVCVLTDLDGFVDDNNVVDLFSLLPKATEIANRRGVSNLQTMIRDIKTNLESLFDYKIINKNGRLGVEVFLKSEIINVSGFPFKAFVDDNVNQIVSAHVRMKN